MESSTDRGTGLAVADHQAPAPPQQRPRRRWLWALILVGVGTPLSAALLWESTASTYTASAQIRLHKEPPHILGDWQPADPSEQEFEVFRQRQAGLVKNANVLNAALRDPQAARFFPGTGPTNPVGQWLDWLLNIQSQPDPVSWLQGHIEVDFVSSPEIMRVRLYGTNREQSRILLTAVVEAYLREVSDSEPRSTRAGLTFIEAPRRIRLLGEITVRKGQ